MPILALYDQVYYPISLMCNIAATELGVLAATNILGQTCATQCTCSVHIVQGACFKMRLSLIMIFAGNALGVVMHIVNVQCHGKGKSTGDVWNIMDHSFVTESM